MQKPHKGVHRAPFLTTCSTSFFCSASPQTCESDDDCLKDKGSCVQRECHCKNADDVGDGKTYCDSKYKNSCNKTLSGVLKNANDQYFSSFGKFELSQQYRVKAVFVRGLDKSKVQVTCSRRRRRRRRNAGVHTSKSFVLFLICREDSESF